MGLLTASVFTFLAGALLTLVVRTAARHLGVVAVPRPDRWHQKPTALLGGIAIYGAFFAGYVLFAPKLTHVYPILASSTLLFVSGLVDDIVQLKPYTKLVLQLLVAVLIVQFGLHLPWTGSRAVNYVITLFWLLGITNAMNLLDNMDGLAGGVSAIACVFLTVTFLVNGQMTEAILPALLGGAVLGFLVFNFPPASIFMGDCGAMFLGLMLSSIALLSDYGRTRNLVSVLLTPVLIMSIPILDTCLVTITRQLAGRPISCGGRDHMSHRLVALGVPERRAVTYLYWLAAIAGTLALLVRWLNTELILLLVPGFVLIVLFFGFYLGKVRVYEAETPPQGNTIIDALVGFAHKRRVFEVLLDITLVALAYYCAYLIRYEGEPPSQQLDIFTRTLPLVIAIQVLFLLLWGVYSGLWHYVGINDLVAIGKAVVTGTATSALAVLAMYGFNDPSRAALILNGLLFLVVVSASRLSFRLFRVLLVDPVQMHPEATPVLIYGAGDGGALLLRELCSNPDHHYTPLGFLDDDTRKVGKHLHGYRIYDSRQFPELQRRHGVSEVLISSCKVPERKLDILRDMGVELKRLSIRIE